MINDTYIQQIIALKTANNVNDSYLYRLFFFSDHFLTVDSFYSVVYLKNVK